MYLRSSAADCVLVQTQGSRDFDPIDFDRFSLRQWLKGWTLDKVLTLTKKKDFIRVYLRSSAADLDVDFLGDLCVVSERRGVAIRAQILWGRILCLLECGNNNVP